MGRIVVHKKKSGATKGTLIKRKTGRRKTNKGTVAKSSRARKRKK